MVHFNPLAKLLLAKETAKLLLQHVFLLHSLPCDIVSDRGPQFTAKFWVKFLGISVSLSSGFHPQSNGQSERLNQELETGLRLLCSWDPAAWGMTVVWVEYTHNSLPSSITGLTPFQVNYRYQPPHFSYQEADAMVPSAFTLVRPSHLAWRRARYTESVAVYV